MASGIAAAPAVLPPGDDKAEDRRCQGRRYHDLPGSDVLSEVVRAGS